MFKTIPNSVDAYQILCDESKKHVSVSITPCPNRISKREHFTKRYKYYVISIIQIIIVKNRGIENLSKNEMLKELQLPKNYKYHISNKVLNKQIHGIKIQTTNIIEI